MTADRPITLPTTIDRQQLIDLIAELLPGVDPASIGGVSVWPQHVVVHHLDHHRRPTTTLIRIVSQAGGTPLTAGAKTGRTPTPSPDLTTGRAPTHRAGGPPTHPR